MITLRFRPRSAPLYNRRVRGGCLCDERGELLAGRRICFDKRRYIGARQARAAESMARRSSTPRRPRHMSRLSATTRSLLLRQLVHYGTYVGRSWCPPPASRGSFCFGRHCQPDGRRATGAVFALHRPRASHFSSRMLRLPGHISHSPHIYFEEPHGAAKK